MQAARPVALLAIDLTQEVRTPAIILGDLGVTLRTLIVTNFGGSLDLNVLAEVPVLLVGTLGLGLTQNPRHEKEKYDGEE